jgi:hypothetical protein
LQPHISPGCNHARQIVAIAHLLSFSFSLFAVTEINQKILQSNNFVSCNHALPRIAIIFQTTN